MATQKLRHLRNILVRPAERRRMLTSAERYGLRARKRRLERRAIGCAEERIMVHMQ